MTLRQIWHRLTHPPLEVYLDPEDWQRVGDALRYATVTHMANTLMRRESRNASAEHWLRIEDQIARQTEAQR